MNRSSKLTSWLASHLFMLMLVCLAAENQACGFQTNRAQPAAQTPDKPVAKQFADLPEEWIKSEPEGARAAIEMPIQPTATTKSFSLKKNAPPITLHKHRATVANGTMSFFLGYHDFLAPPPPSEITDVLDSFIRESIGNVRGLLAAEPKQTDKNKGRRYLFVYSHLDKRYVVNTRLLLVGRRLYQISCIMEKNVYDESIAARFLRSFRVLEPEDDLPPRPPISKEAMGYGQQNAVKK